jgi:hypothetical protein
MRPGRGRSARAARRAAQLPGRARLVVLHPGVGEVIDNCQHVLFGCCTNLTGFYRRIGVADRIHWTSEMTMIEPGGRRSVARSLVAAGAAARPSALPCRRGRSRWATSWPWARLSRPHAADPRRLHREPGRMARAQRQTKGALDRFWRLVIASALNADIDSISLPYAAKVIRELFMNSAEAGKHGHEHGAARRTLRGCAAEFLRRRGGQRPLQHEA